MAVIAAKRIRTSRGVSAAPARMSLAEQAYNRLEEMIVTLELPPGSVVSEAELSRRTKIGRTPLREALQRLLVQNLVTMLPHRGMMISGIDVADYLALLETRRVLDRLVVTKAARRATPEQRRNMRAISGAMSEAATTGDMASFMRADREFDRLIESASRNTFALQASVPLHAHCRRFWYYFRHNGDLKRAARLHAALMQALADGDEEAAAEASDGLMDYLEQFARSALDLA
ncbi:MAG TPA: GntR family transcriptional regulator [Bacteroidota bacterium]|nr:GntR family transcriptional regulator [Bacteroidota bacterium]